MGYNFRIKYKQGKANKVTGALSRKIDEEIPTLAIISFPIVDWIQELKLSHNAPPEIQQMMKLLSHGANDPKGYSLKQGLLLRKGKLVVVPATPFHEKICNICTQVLKLAI